MGSVMDRVFSAFIVILILLVIFSIFMIGVTTQYQYNVLGIIEKIIGG